MKGINRSLSTKWFTFFTKVRPWLICIAGCALINDFVQYVEVYVSYWWMMINLFGAVGQIVLAVMTFMKSRGDYRDFVSFINGALWYEIIYVTYSQGIQKYISNYFDITIAIIYAAIYLVVGYLVWYRLNIKYFRKRLVGPEYADDTNIVSQDYTESQKQKSVKTVFCRKCGSKLIDGAKFCDKCGTKVIERDE